MRDPWTGQGLLFPVETPSHILPTRTTADRYPFHRWFGFVPGFSPEYVRHCVYEAGLQSGEVVLDPFAGCGTTLVEANALGLRSVGFEPHPFLADICRAKLLVGADPAWAQEIRDVLDSYRRELAHRRQTKPGKKEYDSLIYPYFAQMTRVMRSAACILKEDAPVRIILSDAALYGVHIKAHEVLADILRALGYAQIQTRKLRERGTRWVLAKREGAQEGLGEYELTAINKQSCEVER